MVLTGAFVALALWGCESDQAAKKEAKSEESLRARRHSAGQLLAPELVELAGLRPVWDQKLPLKEGEKFVSVMLLGNRLYLRSDQNYLWSLDRAKGTVVFTRSVAPLGIPVLGLAAHENNLISVIGNKLVELDTNSGKEQRVTTLVASTSEQGVSNVDLSIVAPPVRNNQYFYVAATDRRLHVFQADNLVQTFPVTADDDSLITTVLAEDNFIAFGTNSGYLVGMAPDAPKRLWHFKAPEAVAGAIVRDGNSFYFASVDTNVYRVDIAEGKDATMTWKYQTEAMLDRPPLVTRDFVYQYAVGRGLTAIIKQTGKAAWSLPEGMDLLAEAGTRAYVLTQNRTLAVLDNATGKKLYTANFAAVTKHAANTTDARIYLMDETGRVACLEPNL
jgi:hypothetical protein